MNYHIIPQDKFFENYIEDIYRIHQENNNVIWIRGEKGDSPYFHTDRPVEYLGNTAQEYILRIHKIKPNDKLFVSWYDVFIGRIILQSNLKALLYVYLMGGDFYAQPTWWHIKWLLDPITRRRIKKERLFRVFLPLRKPWRWYRLIRFKINQYQQYYEKLETIKRIDYIVLPEHAKEEIRVIHSLYPGCKAEHKIGTFDQNFDLSKDIPLKNIPSQRESIKILLGNSSDPSGNQMDAIHYLLMREKEKYEVYCLLSYGDREVYEWISDYGRSALGGRFHSINKFMEREPYIRFMNEMDIVVMYHNRQQAAGAIMTALALGKPVFLKAKSPLFAQLSEIGIKAVYNVSLMHTINLRTAIFDAQKNRKDTIERLYIEYSNDVRLAHLRELLK